MVVLHYTAMDSVEAACQRLCDVRAEVSAHYLIGADGSVIRMVEDGPPVPLQVRAPPP